MRAAPASTLLACLLLTASVKAQEQPVEAQEQDEPPPAETTPPHEAGNAEEDMQGGGMTEERQLDDQAAREHFRTATRLYDRGNFRLAAREFELAFELSGRPELLYNAYIAHREANQVPDAAAMLERYLDQVPDAPDRTNLEARLAELQRAIAADAEMQGSLEEARARAEREARARRVAESQGEAWPWIILGVGGAALVAGAITGGVALAASDDLRSRCPDNLCGEGATEFAAERSDAQTLALVTDILLIGGGVVAATGLVLGILFGLPRDPEEGDEPAVEASAGCGPAGCMATLRGRF